MIKERNFKIVFDHDEDMKIIRVLMPGMAENGTYYLRVENNNEKPMYCHGIQF